VVPFARTAAHRAEANGSPAPGAASTEDDPCADVKEELRKLKEEKAARERRAAQARKQAAAKRAAAQKAAAAKKASASKTAAKPATGGAAAAPASGDIASRADAWRDGMTLVEEGRYRTAADFLQRIVKSNPRNADAWYWLSRAYHALGDYDRAQWAANVTLEIDRSYPALTKTPSGMQPLPKPTAASKKEPRPSMSVLPVAPRIPAGMLLEPTTITFPYLEPHSGGKPVSGDLSPLAASADETPPYRAASLRYEPFAPLPRGKTPAWMQREPFTEIGRRRSRVDSMAIVKDPPVPIAWKGARPSEVYFWTGAEWARVPRKSGAKKGEKLDALLTRAKRDMDEVIAQTGRPWRESDTPALASSAAHMNYRWGGEIDLSETRQPNDTPAEKTATDVK